MALIRELEKQGNFLFKYRGQFPTILFFIAIPFILKTDYLSMSDQYISITIYCSIFISIIGFLIRFYTIGTTPRGTSGRNRGSQIADELNSSGLYSLIRHPLYLGNYLIWLGISIFTINFIFCILISLLFWIYYERIMYAEERFLEKKFSKEYILWASKIPAFIPNFIGFRKPKKPFSIISVLRREYAGILATVIGFAFIDILKNYNIYGSCTINSRMLIVLTITIILVLILRSLKHYTNLLEEKDRS